MTWKAILASAALALVLAGCDDDFVPYYQVEGLRLLAIGAEPPALLEGEVATASALAVSSVPGAELRYRWSRCPLPTGAPGGFACAIGEGELRAALGDAGDSLPGFDLGDGATALLPYPAALEAVAAACELVRARGIPAFGEEIRCDSRFPVEIKLEVTDGTDSIVGVKALDLVIDPAIGDAARNHNPVIGGMGVPEAAARGAELEIEIDIDPELSAERFAAVPPEGGDPEPRRERLIVTWFTEAGELDQTRTSFIDGEIDLEIARRNTWTPPSPADYPGDRARLWAVLRDNRGGVAWIERAALLEETR
jgi:hypothetical protein